MTHVSSPGLDVGTAEEGAGAEARRVARVMGRLRGRGAGPTLIAIGGLHGNETAGVRALRRVLEDLRDSEADLVGDFVAMAGNRTALAKGVRYVDLDLNRIWTDERVKRLGRPRLRDGGPGDGPGGGGGGGRDHGGGSSGGSGNGDGSRDRREEGGRPGPRDRPGAPAEIREQVELLRELDRFVREARGEVHVLDLHTTSAASGPWATIEDRPPNRAFAARFPVPVVLGLDQRLPGTLLSHLSPRIRVGMGFESGQHDDPRALERMVAAVWIALGATGILGELEGDRVSRADALLREDTTALPRLLELRYRHGVRPEQGFRMKPGYVNLQPVREGEVLAHDLEGEIRAPENGRILMPLYQDQGEDGFFVVREIHRRDGEDDTVRPTPAGEDGGRGP